LLLCGVVQDVAHPGEGLHGHRLRQRLDRYRGWPVFSCRLMAGLSVHRGCRQCNKAERSSLPSQPDRAAAQ
jgi:hypothetical protein